MARFTTSYASRVLAVSIAAGLFAAMQGCTVVQERRVYVPAPLPPQPDVYVAQGPQANPPAGPQAGPGVTIYSPPPEPVVVYQPQVVYEPAPVYLPDPVVTTYETTVIGGGVYLDHDYGARSFRDRRYPYRGGGYVRFDGHDDDHRGDRHDDHGGWSHGRDDDHGNHNDHAGGPRGQRDDHGSGQPRPRPVTPAPAPAPSRPQPPRQNPVAGPMPRPAPAPAPTQAGPQRNNPLLAQPTRDTQQNRARQEKDQDKGGSPRRGGSPFAPR